MIDKFIRRVICRFSLLVLIMVLTGTFSTAQSGSEEPSLSGIETEKLNQTRQIEHVVRLYFQLSRIGAVSQLEELTLPEAYYKGTNELTPFIKKRASKDVIQSQCSSVVENKSEKSSVASTFDNTFFYEAGKIVILGSYPQLINDFDTGIAEAPVEVLCPRIAVVRVVTIEASKSNNVDFYLARDDAGEWKIYRLYLHPINKPGRQKTEVGPIRWTVWRLV